MDRRSFLKGAKEKTIAETKLERTASLSARTNSGVLPYAGAWTKKEVVHLLRRTMFGAKPADVNYFLSKSMSDAVDELLNPSAPLPSPPLKDYDTSGNVTTPDTDVAYGNTWINSVNNDGTIQTRRILSLKKWWIGLQLNQDRSIREKLTLFWHHYFATELAEASHANFFYRHITLLRTSALGNIKKLVYDVTLDPTMLIYLNGRQNTKNAPDENYARELQELFTLGKENNPNYTEQDVIAAARVLTGWEVNPFDAGFPSFFTVNKHDTTNKQFSSFYNNTIITGRNTATAGTQEINDLINMIFSKSNEVSRHIVKRLYRFFVYSEIDAATEINVIEPLAQTLRNNNWEIKPVLSQLLKSEHFFDTLNRGAQIKAPLDLAVGLCREWNVQFPLQTDIAATYSMWNFIFNIGFVLQQNIGDPPSVAGWPAYYQVPQYYELWVNADTLPKRNQFSDVLIALGYTQNNFKLMIHAVQYTSQLTNPTDPNALISEVVDNILSFPLSDSVRTQLKKDFLLSGQEQDYYWSDAWQAYINNPSTSNFNIVNTRLVGLYKYIMNLAEYQLT
jgi:uncharacterized protein (DUF1800 family)